jgi:hypothetical protein
MCPLGSPVNDNPLQAPPDNVFANEKSPPSFRTGEASHLFPGTSLVKDVPSATMKEKMRLPFSYFFGLLAGGMIPFIRTYSTNCP